MSRSSGRNGHIDGRVSNEMMAGMSERATEGTDDGEASQFQYPPSARNPLALISGDLSHSACMPYFFPE